MNDVQYQQIAATLTKAGEETLATAMLTAARDTIAQANNLLATQRARIAQLEADNAALRAGITPKADGV